MTPEEQLQYENAIKRVKNIKNFYSHLLVYVIVNSFIIIKKTQNIDEGETIWHAFYVPLFWGIGLFFHAVKVSNWFPFLGKNWEEKKLQQYIEEEKNKQTKYE